MSLHAADDDLRTSLVPINKRYPIAVLEAAAAEYFEKKGRRISIEWTMMDGANDTLDQADKLAAIANRLRAHVNLIALNPTPLSDERPSSLLHIEEFATALRKRRVNVTVRDTRGRDIDAACGQLRARQPTADASPAVEIISGSKGITRSILTARRDSQGDRGPLAPPANTPLPSRG